MQKIRFKILIPTLVLLLGTIGCSFPGVYKINIQQGNIITQDMLDQLKPGMNRRQVHFILGNPLVDNVFDDSHENYAYTYQHAGEKTDRQLITVYFEEDKYTHFTGELLDKNPAY
ncbi:outer membrane protein assembly factor BamE [Alkalimarinus coralli]|uniref:outer membrane protein assembly factor BamE n=1 Tax=Alkalimarinus coralli TaxID=2935863 RepID=UPI00202B68FA|nr:outer membrane protein assembly factor BamE [Alkalimarinus coralli]